MESFAIAAPLFPKSKSKILTLTICLLQFCVLNSHSHYLLCAWHIKYDLNLESKPA
jgi:hypothetical protein